MQRSHFPTRINKVYITLIVLKMFLILYSKTLPQADGFHPSQRCESVEETSSEYFALECFIRLQGVQDHVNHAGGCLSQEGRWKERKNLWRWLHQDRSLHLFTFQLAIQILTMLKRMMGINCIICRKTLIDLWRICGEPAKFSSANSDTSLQPYSFILKLYPPKSSDLTLPLFLSTSARLW